MFNEYHEFSADCYEAIQLEIRQRRSDIMERGGVVIATNISIAKEGVLEEYHCTITASIPHSSNQHISRHSGVHRISNNHNNVHDGRFFYY